MIEAEFFPASLWSATTDAIALAARHADTVKFDFNGRIILVDADTDPNLIERDFHRQTLREQTIGPDPEPTLSEEQLAAERAAEAVLWRKRHKQSAVAYPNWGTVK